MKKNWHPLFYTFLALALFGFLYMVVTQPLQLLNQIFVLGLVLCIFYLVYRYWLKPKMSPNRGHHYTKPVSKQPSLFLSKGIQHTNSSTAKTTLKKKRKDHPFTVIEGNKGKKKNPFSS